MNGKHFEIGTIQAFLDGETTPDVSLRLSDHIAGCDACARLLATSEEESAVVFSALERELNTLVPTQRLWSRINESITVEKKPSVWEKLLMYVRASLANPSIAAAAGVIMVVGMFAILWMPQNSTAPIADNGAPNVPETPRVAPVVPETAPELAVTNENEKKNGSTYVGESNMSPQTIKRIVNADYEKPVEAPRPQFASDAYLPGEETYLRTIDDLKQNVDTQKEEVMTPSSRVSYERDMAVVNDSIKRMREVARKNPRNQAARQVLYSSYQDKIDLLNSVSQREELIASVK
ncbi:MAG TPA: zf-HC2 domain-containing protein [Pyrinomonadaceae bacterium]|nr:zf-HC2 domain-containing protein [Pyrinomonadaceae bacterium]